MVLGLCSYFVLLILFGAFILMNLTLAVIMTKFHESTELQAKRMKELEQREARRRRLLARKFNVHGRKKRLARAPYVACPARKATFHVPDTFFFCVCLWCFWCICFVVVCVFFTGAS